MNTRRNTEDTLEIGTITLHEGQSDDEIIAALEHLSFAYSPLTGLCGGELGMLARDIRAGRTTIPGRSQYKALDLIFIALANGRVRHAELTSYLRKEMALSMCRRLGPAVLALIGTILLYFFGLPLLEQLASDAGNSGVEASPFQEWMVSHGQATFRKLIAGFALGAVFLVAVISLVATYRIVSVR